MLSQPERLPLAIPDCTSLVEDARKAVRLANYDEALALVAQCDEWPAPLDEQGALVRIDVLTRRDPIGALEELARLGDVFVSPKGRFDYYLATGKAYAHSRNFDAAHAMYVKAADIAPGLDKDNLCALALAQARLKWFRRDYDPNCGEISVAMQASDPNLQVYALAARCWMHASQESYAAQIADLRAALRVAMKDMGACDASAIASCIHALLRVSLEIGDADGMSDGEKAYESLAWTPDIQVERFQSVRALAWHAFLHGHSARAQWLLKDSKTIAPTAAWKVMAHLDRAYIARMNLNEIWANEELLEAHKLARTVQWSETRGEERLALETLAILFAPVDMAQAQRYVSTFIGLGNASVNPVLAMNNDRRAAAVEKYALGRVHYVLGHDDLAKRELEEAYDVLAEVRHHYRAAFCAWALAEATNDPVWIARAREHAGHFPKSPLYERLQDDIDTSEQSDPFAGMTPVQREIAIALCHGAELNDLSKRFSRSTFTLNKQIEAIYGALGVRTRNELRAELQRRGVFG